MLIGVTEGRPVEHDLLVVDVGGGSSELVFVGPERRAEASGLRVGATRLTGQFVAGDPPSSGRAGRPPRRGRRRRRRGAAVPPGRGRPRRRPGLEPAQGRPWRPRLAAADVRATSTRPSGSPRAESSEAIAARHGLRPARARILAAGAAIVEAIMDRYGVAEVRVADGGIREGTVLAVAHAGAGWRDRLEQLAHGWVS